MKITVVGMGYVGLSNAILFSLNNEVVGIEVDEKKKDLINNKISPISDSFIEKYLKEDLNLTVKTDPKKDYKDSELVIIAVPTNYDEKKDYFDTSIVERVIKDILEVNKDMDIVIKSTIPIGFTQKARKENNTENIIFSPEFLREGKALYDSLYPSRIIIGEKSQRGEKILNLYKKAALNNPETFLMDSTEAEAVKLFANTYLAMRVSYFNELDSFASKYNLNTKDIINGVSSDPRIGNMYNNPSFGYGGYCLPKDTKQLLSNFKDVPNEIIKAIVDANDTRKKFVAKEILDKKPKVVGVYRLTMKSGSDNFRKSAIFDVINFLKEENVDVIIYEPTLKEESYEGLKIVNDFSKFIESDIIIANRYDSNLDKIKDKVYTKDIFFRD
ncbi:MAG: nucleotide sugar dehydrogenase [Tissierellia bacterium]|nr:nucleotide sugar dehydrogenase [Tissierellia bacterium]